MADVFATYATTDRPLASELVAIPTVEPSATALVAKCFKYEVLTWIGIVGGALTLFGNLDAVLKLADWARVLVQQWKEWTHAFWVWAFGWLGIHLGPGWTPVLSFLLFGSLLAIGQAVKFKSTIKNQATKAKYQGKSFHLISWRTLSSVIAMFVVSGLLQIWADRYYPGDFDYYLAIGAIAVIISPIVLFARHRLHAAISVGLMLTFFIIIAFDPLRDLGRPGNPDLDVVGAITLGLICMLPLILLSVAPAKAIIRRLIFLALGLLLLIALNELSKLGLDLTAPKLQG